MPENDDVGLPGDADFAGDYDGHIADAEYLDRFPVSRNQQRGGRKISDKAA